MMTITEVSKQYGISADTLRYYERIGLIPSVNRTPSGIRDYTQDDCGWVVFAKHMRGAGLPIEALIDYVALFLQGDETREARKNILVEQRNLLQARIGEMQSTLDRLTSKIAQYDETLRPVEERLQRRDSD